MLRKGLTVTSGTAGGRRAFAASDWVIPDDITIINARVREMFFNKNAIKREVPSDFVLNAAVKLGEKDICIRQLSQFDRRPATSELTKFDGFLTLQGKGFR